MEEERADPAGPPPSRWARGRVLLVLAFLLYGIGLVGIAYQFAGALDRSESNLVTLAVMGAVILHFASDRKGRRRKEAAPEAPDPEDVHPLTRFPLRLHPRRSWTDLESTADGRVLLEENALRIRRDFLNLARASAGLLLILLCFPFLGSWVPDHLRVLRTCGLYLIHPLSRLPLFRQEGLRVEEFRIPFVDLREVEFLGDRAVLRFQPGCMEEDLPLLGSLVILRRFRAALEGRVPIVEGPGFRPNPRVPAKPPATKAGRRADLDGALRDLEELKETLP